MMSLLAAQAGALEVLLLAGGGEAPHNYHSHAVHVRALAAHLTARGVPPSRIALSWADGRDPAPDRAVVREAPAAGDWILHDTHLDGPTDPGLSLENTEFPGFEVFPARRNALRKWLSGAARRLQPGDTLFIAVTDHGEADPKAGDGHGRDTRIVLWGQRWTQRAFREDLSVVPEGVRVVLWMSQCFSGGFADVALDRPNTCGAFSANATEVAYGCFPELAGRTDVGHFVHMLDGLAATGSLGGASDWAMLRDDTPDQPHLSSDVLLTDWLNDEAERRRISVDALVDEGLARVPADHPDRAFAARIADAYGLGAIPDQTTMGARLDTLDRAEFAVETWRDLWTAPTTGARRWLAGPFTAEIRKGATPEQKRVIRAAFVERLAAAARDQPGLEELLMAMAAKQSGAATAADTLGTQIAATLRIGDLHARLAAPHLLPPDAAKRWEALRACERAPLVPPAPEMAGRVPSSPPPLPAATETLAAAEQARPGYFGVSYQDQGEDDPTAVARRSKGVPVGRGPVLIGAVLPDGPADRAGLQRGDVVTAVDDEVLSRPGRFREMAFFSAPGQVRRLRVVRGGETLSLRLSATAFPMARRPLEIGDPAGELPWRPLDEPLPMIGGGQGRGAVLAFWATWCKPCKASFPALAAYAEKHGLDVVAVTDEREADVRAWLGARTAPFPFPIALDGGARTGGLFGVDATPTFVRLDAAGRYVERGVGFERTLPLGTP
jgi:thiol-disulfide isomerase/thioredoxin